MKKILQFFGLFLAAGLLFWAYPLFIVALSAPAQAVDALSMTKTDELSQVAAGDGVTHTYTIRVTNLALTRTKHVVVRDTWPDAFMRGTVTTTQGSCNNTDTGFSCSIGTMQAGGQVTITAPYTVPPGTAPGTYTNTAVVTGENSPAVTAYDETSVVSEADVRLLSKTDNPDPVNSGDNLTYNLSVSNFGPASASEVTLIDTLPAGTEYQDSPSTESCSGPLAGPVTCPLGQMTPGSNRQVVIVVRVTLSTPGTLHNTANVTTTTNDPDPNNNAKAQDTTVIVDVTKPVVTWVAPVPAENDYPVNCRPVCESIHFEANATDNFGVQRVNFFRWDHVLLDYVNIGDDSNAPYMWEFDSGVLPWGYNQIYAQAYDTAGLASDRKRIFLDKMSEDFLPLIRRLSN